jgi:hypothetical protein
MIQPGQGAQAPPPFPILPELQDPCHNPLDLNLQKTENKKGAVDISAPLSIIDCLGYEQV